MNIAASVLQQPRECYKSPKVAGVFLENLYSSKHGPIGVEMMEKESNNIFNILQNLHSDYDNIQESYSDLVTSGEVPL